MNELKEIRLGPLWFTPGVTGINLATMIFAAFGSLAIVSFMSFMQPYVLNELLHVPEAQQGALTGNLHAFQEVIFIAVAGFIGAASDKLGRPLIYLCGFLVAAVGYAVYPLATTLEQLYLSRAVFAVGVAGVAVMLSACLVDYIRERSRGRWLGITSLFNGLGILAMSFLLARLPAAYQDGGASPEDAGRFAFWTVAGLCLVVGTLLYLGLFRGGTRERPNEALLKRFFQGLRAGRDNPRLAIAYGGAFIGRGDFAVVGTFFSLWMVQEGLAQGRSTAESLKSAGMLFGMIQLCALIWAPFMGFISDRLNRLSSVMLGLAIAGTGYLWMSMVSDPFSAEIWPAVVILGMGETGVIVSVGALLGQEAHGTRRGSIVGVFSLLGGLGILVTTLAGGQLFDGIGRTAPFAMMGLLNFLLMGGALVVYLSRHRNAPATDAAMENATE